MLKILIPTDGSQDALSAVHHALQLVAKGLHARFVVANVQDPATLYEMVVAHDPVVLERIRESAGQDLMAEAVRLLQVSGQQVEQVVVTGDPARMLVEVIEQMDCDAVIMGCHAAGGFAHAMQGASVSQELVQLSPVPVTVVKPAMDSEHLSEPMDAMTDLH